MYARIAIGWFRRLLRDVRDKFRGVRQSFDQDNLGTHLVEIPAQVPRPGRRQVPHSEHVNPPRRHVLCSEQEVNSGRQSAPRFFITFERYSCQTILSFSSSLTIEPCRPAAMS